MCPTLIVFYVWPRPFVLLELYVYRMATPSLLLDTDADDPIGLLPYRVSGEQGRVRPEIQLAVQDGMGMRAVN